VGCCGCRDGWDALLLHCLLLLQQVTQRLKLHKESLLHSLEIACLAHSLAANKVPNKSSSSNSLHASTAQVDNTHLGRQWLADSQQPAALAAAAVKSILAGATDQKVGIIKALTPPPQQQGAADGAPVTGSDPPSAGSPAAAAAAPAAAASQSTGAADGFKYVVQQLDLAAALQQQQQQQQPGQDPPGVPGLAVDLLLQ
jgi:hypothetical protein